MQDIEIVNDNENDEDYQKSLKEQVNETKKLPLKTKENCSSKEEKFSVFQALYLLSKKNEEKKEKMREQKEKEIKEICTFKPSITKYKLKQWEKENGKNHKRSDSSMNNSISSNLFARMNFYLEKSKQKTALRAEKEENKEDKEEAELTFTPEIHKEVPEFEEQNIKGTKVFLERQLRSQQLKNEAYNKLNPNYNSLYEKLFQKKQKQICEKKLTKKKYEEARAILHKELLSK